MAAPSALILYRNNLDVMKLSDLTGVTVRMALLTSSYTPSAGQTGHTAYSELTNELTTSGGYTLGGVSLASTAVATYSTTGFKFSTDKASWTASGGGIPAWRYGVIYADATLWSITKPLIGYFIGDSTPADAAATTSGALLEINCPTDGWFYLNHA